ncbi:MULTISPECIES: ABC transporter ATP-binding protein [Thermus]|jgi:ABC-2 type transport system ATP-binding protein|uniref:ABC transporter ATP-binding protein n=1 Tax=Thermus brockianus TaxID=56956 RepID=A0A1J0LRR5_THEBO|nr:ABC transporter ATP-binding protein [Thermus brockianus]APD09025.1 ABC transporter ATP-binding protein [Thermus brockianus]BDG15542.1 ABC transporter ATP-binding protein [Thermus brockianus]
MEPLLWAQGLVKRFGALFAVRRVSLALRPGEVLAFLGKNGAGKTTTVKMLASLLLPDEGEVRLLGQDPFQNPWALRHLGAVLEGNRNVYWRLTPLENLVYFGVARGLRLGTARKRALALLEEYGLLEKAHTEVRHLSRGMQQKLALLQALIHDPEVLLLDEPTLGLDVETALLVREKVRALAQSGKAILLTTHQLEVAEALADRIAIIHRGEVVLEEEKGALLARFAGDHYVLEVEGPLPGAVLARLRALGVEGEGPFLFRGDGEALWAVLDALKPLPLKRVAKAEADLLEIFLKVVGHA